MVYFKKRGLWIMNENICYFIPFHKDYQSIHTINLVLETKPRTSNTLKTEAVYKVHFVCGGSGCLHTLGRVRDLSEGDVFFTFPGSPFYIESKADFSYMYISFLGTRANQIMEKLKISAVNCYFPDCGAIYDFWSNAFGVNEELTDIISESVLLYTFSHIGSKTLTFDAKTHRSENAFFAVKKYVDDNFTNPALSLCSIGKELLYSPKYISGLFKKKMNVGLTEYINTVRIQYTCTLINRGFTSVKELAVLSGYRDALYFSKVFKKKMGISPREYMLSQSNRRLGGDKA